MKNYGKLEHGHIRYAPTTVEWQGHVVNNPDGIKLKELGYLPIKYVDMPQDAPEGQHYEPSWEQTATEIVQVWKLIKDEPIPEMPQTIEERVTAVENSNEELATTVDSILTEVIPSIIGI